MHWSSHWLWFWWFISALVRDLPSHPRKQRGKKAPEHGEYIPNFITYSATLNWPSLVPACTLQRTVHLDLLLHNPLQYTAAAWLGQASSGQAVNNLLNCHEIRLSLAPLHWDAWSDIGSITAWNQVNPGQAFDFLYNLCPFQLLCEDGAERLAASSQRERVRWVKAIW